MNKKILALFEKVGMKHFWGNFFDSRFYVAYLISKTKTKVILDVGCGTGILLKISPAEVRIGLDYSFDSLRDTKLLDPKLELICGDAAHLPFKDRLFSNILAIHILVELKKNGADWEKALLELKRVASLNSEIVLAGNNRTSRHFENDPADANAAYLTYKEQENLFKKDFEVEIDGYDPHPKIIMCPLKKIIFKLPERPIELLKIEQILFRLLRSKRYLKNGRSYVIICKKKLLN